jgi:hypothetical protein
VFIFQSCYNCQEKGHKQSNCPQLQGKNNKKKRNNALWSVKITKNSDFSVLILNQKLKYIQVYNID